MKKCQGKNPIEWLGKEEDSNYLLMRSCRVSSALLCEDTAEAEAVT